MNVVNLIGRKFDTLRFGPVTFRDRPYTKARDQLIEWPGKLLYNVYDELPKVGHPLTLVLLEKAWYLMAERAMNYAQKHGGKYTPGHITTNGFYRPPGTTWGLGKFQDPHGVIDTTDDYGHWWMAIDIDIGGTACSWEPRLTESSVVKCLRKVGLRRPFSCESWHWRPGLFARQKYFRRNSEDRL